MATGRDGITNGRLRRAAPLASMAARATGDRVIAALRRDSDPDSVTGLARRADRYVEALGRSKGALMKVGQLVSFVPLGAAIPPESQRIVQTALSRLQAQAPPMAPDLAAEVVAAELGAPPDKVFRDFEAMPFAAASIGQVHRATLPDGRPVAVKVQYPGVGEAIRTDLKNAELIAVLFQFLRSVMPGMSQIDPKLVAAEISERVTEELDYCIEAKNQQDFADAYRGHPFVRIPEVVAEFSTERVLTQDLATGRPWIEALDADQDLKDKWSEVIYRFVFGSLRRLCLFNADPHPGNYLFGDDGTVTFLDFGCVKRFDPAQVALMQDVVRAAVLGNGEVIRDRFIRSGLFDEATAPSGEDLLAWWGAPMRMLTAPQPFRITRDHVSETVLTEFSPLGPSADVVRRMQVARDFIFMSRVDVGLMSVLGELEPTGNWRGIYEEMDLAGAPCTPMGEADAAFWGARSPLPAVPDWVYAQ
ncbi:MAG TPA: AarF/ABC1/UbiB kinase family protein [Mycobacteriales bacterium]|nr:AarF/ABC1/UbiB kinase family protein [Mycobacteriales bacterium]